MSYTHEELHMLLLRTCAQQDEDGAWYCHDASGNRHAKTLPLGYGSINRGTSAAWEQAHGLGLVVLEGHSWYLGGLEYFHLRLTDAGVRKLTEMLLRENQKLQPDLFVDIAEGAILKNEQLLHRFIR